MDGPIKIPREAVTSSNLESVGYDPKRQIVAVAFKSGAVFNFAPFSMEQMTAFYTATSKGKWFAEHIKGKISGVKCTGECPACGAKGWIGDKCEDCGCKHYEDKGYGRRRTA